MKQQRQRYVLFIKLLYELLNYQEKISHTLIFQKQRIITTILSNFAGVKPSNK